LASLLASAAHAAGERQTLADHVPAIVSRLPPTGRLEASQRLHLAIGLPSRDEQGLDEFLRQLYNPASAHYRHYLTPAEFTARFGPSEKDYQSVIDYAKASGLTVTRQHANRVVLDVEGAVGDIENALQIALRTYRHPTEARDFYSLDNEPSIPLGLPAVHIIGLNNYTLPHPRHQRRADFTAKAGSAPGGQLWGSDFRDAYVPGTSLTGAGQNIGLVEFEGFYAKDITNYEDAIGLSADSRPELVVVSLGGGATPQDGGDNGEECSIDIELAIAMAPGLSKIYVFEDGGNPAANGSFDDIFESMVSHTDILQFSCSWGGSTDKDPASEVLFKQMAAQGQSFLDASGDAGAFVGAVQFPSDSPSITQVGGTTLTDGAAPAHAWESEVVWDWDSGPQVSAAKAASSSGGISTYYPIPDWQTNFSMAANLGSTTMRNTPDVAADADNCYVFSDDGQQAGGFGGTSCAAPLWAGLVALMNQQAAAGKMAPVGFLNPALYALASSTNYSACFHDITSGNNTWKESPDQFHAVAGYDLCCGLGSMKGLALINALVGPNTGTEASSAGDLTVALSPAAAKTAGAKWQVDGGTWEKSGATLANLTPGNHTVSFSTIRDWATPAAQTVVIQAGSTATATGDYLPAGSLKVTLEPALATNGGSQWQVDGGPWQDSGATVANLAVGHHTLSFNSVGGWTAPSNQSVAIKDGSITRITAGYTFAAAGIYNGLFAWAPSAGLQTSGMLSELDVTTSGTYSGKLLLAGSSTAISGNFNPSGQASNTVKRSAAQGGPFTLAMTLNWNESPPSITGTVSSDAAGGWIANLTNELALATSNSSAYTALMSPGTPPGYGYILLTNHAGMVTLQGALADGTSFSQVVPLSSHGDLPVYAELYGGQGLLLGWLNLENGSPSGNLTWIKQGSRSGSLYADGFTNQVSVQGSPWVSSGAITLPAGQLFLSGGGLPVNLSFKAALSHNTLMSLPGGATNSLTGSINAKTGLMTIKFGNGNGQATTTGIGAFLQNTTNAGGFFLGKTNAGSILLQP
jgi:hypothetical protein